MHSRIKRTKMETEIQTDVGLGEQCVMVSSKLNDFLKFIRHSDHARKNGYLYARRNVLKLPTNRTRKYFEISDGVAFRFLERDD